MQVTSPRYSIASGTDIATRFVDGSNNEFFTAYLNAGLYDERFAGYMPEVIAVRKTTGHVVLNMRPEEEERFCREFANPAAALWTLLEIVRRAEFLMSEPDPDKAVPLRRMLTVSISDF